MFKKPPVGLFVTGTDTEVGKTYVGALIVKSLVDAGYRVGVYKPSASDCVHDGQELVSEDAVALWEAAGRPLTLNDVCPQRFRAPLAPHLSARAEGRQMDIDLLRNGISRWEGQCDLIVVEGSGGLMSPISDEEYVADLAFDFGYPVVVVAPNVLGVINQTLQTLITASCFRGGIPVGGVVLNNPQVFEGDRSIPTNPQEIECRIQVPLLAKVDYEASQFSQPVNWHQVATESMAVDISPPEGDAS
ncbi:MAG: dethiobiotin synthase [Mariniblastus sp.]|nr:dethiobiotin synthase [Mariniblastus sp.]